MSRLRVIIREEIQKFIDEKEAEFSAKMQEFQASKPPIQMMQENSDSNSNEDDSKYEQNESSKKKHKR